MAFNLHPTALHHCDVIGGSDSQGVNSNYTNCKINPGHKNFLSVSEFETKHLSGLKEDFTDWVKSVIDGTVRITVSSTSSKRPDTFPGSQKPYPFIEHKGKSVSRCGTGYIYCRYPVYKTKRRPCPCRECIRSDQPKMKYWKITVGTVTHVVFDRFEAESVIVDLFYDTEDRHGVKHLYGVDVKGTHDTRYESDACDVVCVTHDEELVKRVKNIRERIAIHGVVRELDGIIVSHPHGASKKISVSKAPCKRHNAEPNHTKLIEGTLVYIPSSSGQHGHTYNNDTLSHMLSTPASHNTNDNNPKSDISPTSKCHLGDFVTPYLEPELFKLKYEIKIVRPANDESVANEVNDSLALLDPSTLSSDPDTKFMSPSGNELEIPMGTGFYPAVVHRYLTYDIPTCPGSSGAIVWNDFPLFSIQRFRHFGTCGSDSGGRNQSGLYYDTTIFNKYNDVVSSDDEEEDDNEDDGGNDDNVDVYH